MNWRIQKFWKPQTLPEKMLQGKLGIEKASIWPICRAIGAGAIEAEIDDLFNWIKKLEAKKNKKSMRVSKPIYDDEDIEDDVCRKIRYVQKTRL